ncbi:helix-turn-helix domain-containing protein [Dactylosporangium sp. NPDC000244]|uniref:helix-turn-helix domain-containing protein n=1 Tax=Dactylosporangium sp. NPDC000244 TaxID=3154365 RepID=UPI0033276A45
MRPIVLADHRQDARLASINRGRLQLLPIRKAGDSVTRSSVLGAATKVEASAHDHDTVAQVSAAVAHGGEVSVRLPGGTEVVLPEPLAKILRASAEELSAGHSVTILASESLLTPAEVGQMLGLSRPFVARLLDHGQIPFERLPNSNHRVVKLADVLAFQERRERRRTGNDRIAELIESEDYPY